MKISENSVEKFEKDNVGLKLYLEASSDMPCDFLRVSVSDDHEREFSNSESTFIYYVMEGEGEFWLDGEKAKVSEEDVIKADPGTRIYYRGDMEMILVTSPSYDESNDNYYGKGKEKYLE